MAMSPITSRCRSAGRGRLAGRRAAEECQTSSGALRPPRYCQRRGSIGQSLQPHRRPLIGEFGDARLLKKFGNVPDISAGCRDIVSYAIALPSRLKNRADHAW